jgi:hypothetical protein
MISVHLQAQEQTTNINGFLVPACIYEGDTIASLRMPTLYCFKPMKFKNKKQQQKYNRLVRNVKKTLPNEKDRQKHLQAVEKSVKEQYTPRMKKLTFSQGKLLIKLINRETDSSSYELVKAFLGPFKAGFYQAFAAIFGASLKKEYHPEDEDAEIERIVLLVESGQI